MYPHFRIRSLAPYLSSSPGASPTCALSAHAREDTEKASTHSNRAPAGDDDGDYGRGVCAVLLRLSCVEKSPATSQVEGSASRHSEARPRGGR